MPAMNYIRRKDRLKFSKKKVDHDSPALLIRFKGTIKEAKRKRVPVFGHGGKRKRTSYGS